MKGLLWVTIGICVGMLLLLTFVRRRRGQQQAIQRFRQRAATDDASFLKACDVPQDAFRMRVALAARQVIAELGEIPPESVAPEDTLAEDLIGLPFWDSLDWLEYIFSVERKADVKIPRGVFEGIAESLKQEKTSALQVRHVVKATAMAASA